jgi:hypothetical protein
MTEEKRAWGEAQRMEPAGRVELGPWGRARDGLASSRMAPTPGGLVSIEPHSIDAEDPIKERGNPRCG